MTADLHIHTTASDGRLSPREIYYQAKLANLKSIAITDHDTIQGVLDLRSFTISGIHIIPGIELNTDITDYEVHILGYNIDVTSSQLITELDKLAKGRTSRAQKIVDRVTDLGFPIEYNRVLQIAATSKSLGRPHIARALIEKGYFSTMSEVFNSLLARNAPAYVPHYKLAPEEAIRLIEIAGGIPVLAHPGLIGNNALIIELIRSGLRGLEIYHPKHTELQIKEYLALANEYRLKVTGGSDFHGIPGRFPEQLGQFTVPAYLADKLSVSHA